MPANTDNQDWKSGYEAAQREMSEGYQDSRREISDSNTRWQRDRDRSINTQVALLGQTIENLQREIMDINGSMKELRVDIKNINDMANKYRGGLLVVLALGGVIGTIVTLSDKIVHWFH